MGFAVAAFDESIFPAELDLRRSQMRNRPGLRGPIGSARAE